MVAEYWAAAEARDWGAFGALLADDVVYEVPQTRERVSGRDAYVRFDAEGFPGDWHLAVQRIVSQDRAAVSMIEFSEAGASQPGLCFFDLDSASRWSGSPISGRIPTNPRRAGPTWPAATEGRPVPARRGLWPRPGPGTPSPGGLTMASVIAFDVNETLLDLRALDAPFEAVLGDAALRPQWLAQMLQLAFVGGLTGQYVDFTTAQRAALVIVGERGGVPLGPDDIDGLVALMSSLPPHPEVADALAALAATSLRLVAWPEFGPGCGQGAVRRRWPGRLLRGHHVRRRGGAPQAGPAALSRSGRPVRRLYRGGPLGRGPLLGHLPVR